MLAIVAVVAVLAFSGSKPSDENQIRHLAAEFTRAVNRFGTLSTVVESIEIDGDVAIMKTSNLGSKQTDPQESTAYLLREDGSWKCRDTGSIRKHLRD